MAVPVAVELGVVDGAVPSLVAPSEGQERAAVEGLGADRRLLFAGQQVRDGGGDVHERHRRSAAGGLGSWRRGGAIGRRGRRLEEEWDAVDLVVHVGAFAGEAV